MPNRIFPQAEVRLVQRGDEQVVQSAILPHFPNKVLDKITKSEHDNWQDNPDAQEYVATLEEAFRVYIDGHDLQTTALVIDFVTKPEASRIDFRFADAKRNKAGIVLQSSPVWRSLPLNDHYIRKNQEYIIKDAFGKNADTLIHKLRTSTSAPDGE